MAQSVLEVGEKLHIITRRLFSDDVRRHFVGEVTGIEGPLCEVRGYVFVFHPGPNDHRRRPELRTRIYALGDVGHIVNKIPTGVDIGSLQYRMVDKRLVVTDGQKFSLDINEFGPSS